MAIISRIFPVYSGKEQRCQDFVDELCKYPEDIDKFYSSIGIVRETWHFQRMDHGSFLLLWSELSDDFELENYSKASCIFATWFKTMVLEITGIDPNIHPAGPAAELMYIWQSPELEDVSKLA